MRLKAAAPLRFSAAFFRAARFQSKLQNLTISLCVLRAAKRENQNQTQNSSLLQGWQASSVINEVRYLPDHSILGILSTGIPALSWEWARGFEWKELRAFR